ncbi:MAG TPA: DNA photolyase [bacterium]|nr:DNA photolyase [bacterium]
MLASFAPQILLLEAAVAETPLARRLLGVFPEVRREIVESLGSWKEPQAISPAKRILAIAQAKGEAVKPFPKIKHAINLDDYVFNPISNCHLECTYCILQSYLKNNPVLTVYANTGHFLAALRNLDEAGTKPLRVGTGELSDSLALDALTGLGGEWVPFFAARKNLFLELKTKSDCIAGLLKLEHRGRTVLSWSLAPEAIVKREELKCASLAERLEAAAQAQAAGYPVGLHLDPLICHPGWEEAYDGLIAAIAARLDPKRLAWVSVGSLRFDKALKEIATERFPQTAIFAEDFIQAPDGKFRYFKTLRREMYRRVWRRLAEWSLDFPRYLCMEPPWMWEEVTAEPAPLPQVVEHSLSQRLKELAA